MCFEWKFTQLIDKKKIELPISNGFLAVTRIISKGIKIFHFSLDISDNISHFTYLLTYFRGSRQKQRNQIRLDNIKTFVARAIKKNFFLMATVILKTISQAGAITLSHRVAVSSHLPAVLEKHVKP